MTLLGPAHLRLKLQVTIKQLLEILEGLDGRPFHWHTRANKTAITSLGYTLVTKRELKARGFRLKTITTKKKHSDLKTEIEPVGFVGYQGKSKTALYLLESQCVKL